jgi:hypothetical protein
MPLPTVPKGAFPNVPNVPGVPPLDRLGGKIAFLEPANIFSSQLLRVPYLQGILQAAKAEVWGVFNKASESVIVANVFMELSQSSASKIARFYVEDGTFANYNKVQEPDETTIVMVKTGTAAELGQYISEVEALKRSTELFDIVTPERILKDVNLETYDYARRRDDGVNLITFNMNFIEIREVALTYSNRTIPSAAALQDRGQQQPKEPRVSLLSKLQTAVGA